VSDTDEYNKLLEEYRNLQLRVTKFSAVEQAMINIRDRLDSELDMHKRMHTYSTLALKCNSENEFAALTAESIVGIFETEMALVFIDKLQDQQSYIFSWEGVESAFVDTNKASAILRSLAPKHSNAVKVLSAGELKMFQPVYALKEALWYHHAEKELGFSITVVGMNSIARAPLYNTIETRLKAIFSVFCQQVTSILTNITRGQTIKMQFEALTAATTELNKLSLIATKTQNCVIITDANGKIEWVNRAFEELYDYRLEEIAGKLPREVIVAPDSQEVIVHLVKTAVSARQTQSKNISTFSKHHHEFRSFIEITPVFNESDDLTNTVALIKDITEIHNYQVSLEQKNIELKKINSELDNFVYSVSHDLRSPLLSIKGLLNLIAMDETKNNLDLSYIQLALTSVDRLDDTIQEILDYSRNARFDLNLTQVDLREIVQHIFEDLKYSVEPRVHFALEVTGSSVITTDEYRLETILKNLVGNGFKYRKTGSDQCEVRVTVDTSGKAIKIAVSDNGMGISQKNLPRIFEMFYRGSSEVPGTGLGLYICKEIIEKLNGTISAKSEVGKGTTVKLQLPAQPNKN
jgi:PAS domain S-box-containing protein